MPAPSPATAALNLRPGERVRVRPADEIFATLDESGALDGLPFMPEMVKYCGKAFSVAQRADKTCAGDGLVRRMRNAVHLGDVRCDGSAHEGCQAACLMYWKEAWLERADGENGAAPQRLTGEDESYIADTLEPGTRAEPGPEGQPRYRCQATEIPNATGRPLRLREVDQYVRDLRNWPLWKIVRGLLIEAVNLWQSFSSRHLPRALQIGRGQTYPFVLGDLEKGTTPSGRLDLRPGDYVRVKSKEEIVSTLDRTNHNRGLSFDAEMANYCGRTARVRARVNRLVDEHSGDLIEIDSDCIILDGVVCLADYHRFCTRGIYPYWREIWLERVSEPVGANGSAPANGNGAIPT